MNKFDWISTIKINLKILRIVGLWPEKFYRYDFYSLYSLFNAIFIVGGHNLSQLMNVFFVYKDLQALMSTIFILTTNILAVVKMCYFARHQKSIKKLLNSLNDPIFLPKSLEQIELVRPSLKRWTKSYTVYSVIVASNLTLWILTPFFTEDFKFPFLAWYPLNVDKTPAFQIIYTYQAICICYITIANINLDSLIYALLMYIWSQCDILCDDLSRLTGNEFNRKLLISIKHHKEIMSFAEKSNRLFDIVILGQFVTSTIALASSMFQLSLSDPHSFKTFANINYLIGIPTQLFLYCWFGTQVETKSSQLLYCVFQSEWYNQPRNVKRTLLIMNEKFRRPIKITAINLFTLQISTFVNILRTAWSYFALLVNVNDGN